jgi:hypothetical protein
MSKPQEVNMAKKSLFLGMLAMALVLVGLFTSCASLTWNSPITEDGSISALQTAEQNAGGVEVASYSLIFGFIPLGRETFSGLVVAASRSGKKVDIMYENYLIFQKLVAYSRD